VQFYHTCKDASAKEVASLDAQHGTAMHRSGSPVTQRDDSDSGNEFEDDGEEYLSDSSWKVEPLQDKEHLHGIMAV